MRIHWDKTDGWHSIYEVPGIVHVFNWQHWQWQQSLGGSTPKLPFMSPFEWPEFWAGVLDVLFLDREGSLGQSLSADAIVPWTLGHDGFISIGLVRATQPRNDERPAWYEDRKTRWQILLED